MHEKSSSILLYCYFSPYHYLLLILSFHHGYLKVNDVYQSLVLANYVHTMFIPSYLRLFLTSLELQ